MRQRRDKQQEGKRQSRDRVSRNRVRDRVECLHERKKKQGAIHPRRKTNEQRDGHTSTRAIATWTSPRCCPVQIYLPPRSTQVADRIDEGNDEEEDAAAGLASGSHISTKPQLTRSASDRGGAMPIT